MNYIFWLNLILILCSLNLRAELTIHSYFKNLFKYNPVETEYKAYMYLKKNKYKFKNLNYLAVPWATLISANKISELPKIKLNGGFTVCQHCKFEKIIDYLKSVGVTTLFASNLTKEQKFNGITVLPFPQYPMNTTKPSKNKDILYSFVGSGGHIVRNKIFSLRNKKDNLIIRRHGWHFYNNSWNQKINDSIEYTNILARSRYSLCPRGAGASSIRFWESLKAEAIPVLISDSATLPSNFNWKNAIVTIKEKDVNNMDYIIRNISPIKELNLRRNCKEAYLKLCHKDNFISPILDYYNLN